MNRKIILLTEGYSDPHRAKTARNLIYYCPEEVLAIFDRNNIGKKSNELVGVGDFPVIGNLDDFPEAKTLIMAVALPGGKIPISYKEIMLDAIKRKMDVVSCGHEFISDDKDLVTAALANRVRLIDVRKNNEKDVAKREGILSSCLRIQTVGNDCSIGKMVTSVELARALKRKNIDAKFVATGQTGILIEGDGIPIDAVVGDYINGAAEKLVLQNQHHDIIIIEGQGSILHPRYSAVTLGLLHGAMPHGLIMCYEVGRKFVHNMPNIPLLPIEYYVNLYEKLSSAMHPCKVIGFALNSKKVTAEEAEIERQKIKKQFGLPACDVVRDGPDELVEAIIEFQKERITKTVY